LIEVICALAVMMFLFGGIYGIASGALTLSRASNEARLEELRLNNLDALLRTAFENMPVNAQFELSSDGGDGQSNLTLQEAPGVLCWRSQFAVAGTVALRTEPDLRRKGALRLVIEHKRDSTLVEQPPLGDIKVLGGLKSASWRLLNPETKQWEPRWLPQQGRPLLAEFTFKMMDFSDEQRLVFWIPAYQPPRQNSIQGQSPPTPNPLQTSAPAPGSGPAR
jgi:hypothetical protein